MVSLSIRAVAALALIVLALVQPVCAQERLTSLPPIGGDVDERARLAHLIDSAATDGYLLRSGVMWPHSAGTPPTWTAILPRVEFTSNSALPFGLNDGSLWAGRGISTRLQGGVRVAWRSLRVTIAPELTYSANRSFPLPDTAFIPAVPAGYSPYSTPLHRSPETIDEPLRFGPAPFTTVWPGQSTIALARGPLEFGASTANQWWGPGIQNALVLSNNAAGVPRIYLATARPVATRLGLLEARLQVGALTESRWFDTVATNNVRAMSAMILTWSPAAGSGVTLGYARAVYRPVGGWGQVPGHLFDVLTSWRRPNARPVTDTVRTPGPDQVFSLFGRFVLPASHFEAWVEWGRSELPASLRDLLVAPGHSQGYVLGFQWARPDATGRRAWRVQGEVTKVERDASFRDRPTTSWYTSRSVAQGYTQRGEVIGAAIGPGGTSQGVALDYFTPRWRAGVFASRIRWENDALYEIPLTPLALRRCANDVTLQAGVRAGWRTALGSLTGSLATARRYNTWFQHVCVNPGDPDPRDDRDNLTLMLSIAPGERTPRRP